MSLHAALNYLVVGALAALFSVSLVGAQGDVATSQISRTAKLPLSEHERSVRGPQPLPISLVDLPATSPSANSTDIVTDVVDDSGQHLVRRGLDWIDREERRERKRQDRDFDAWMKRVDKEERDKNKRFEKMLRDNDREQRRRGSQQPTVNYMGYGDMLGHPPRADWHSGNSVYDHDGGFRYRFSLQGGSHERSSFRNYFGLGASIRHWLFGEPYGRWTARRGAFAAFYGGSTPYKHRGKFYPMTQVLQARAEFWRHHYPVGDGLWGLKTMDYGASRDFYEYFLERPDYGLGMVQPVLEYPQGTAVRLPNINLEAEHPMLFNRRNIYLPNTYHPRNQAADGTFPVDNPLYYRRWQIGYNSHGHQNRRPGHFWHDDEGNNFWDNGLEDHEFEWS